MRNVQGAVSTLDIAAGTLLEPATIVLKGAAVGFIVLAKILPIFALGDTLPMQRMCIFHYYWVEVVD